MEQTNLISAAMKVHFVSNLNTYILTGEREFLLHYENIFIPNFMPGSFNYDVYYIHEQIDVRKNQLYTYTNEWDLHYLCYTFVKDKSYTIIIGPYLELTPNVSHLRKFYNLNADENNILRKFCDQIQVLNVDKIKSFSNILPLIEQMSEISYRPKSIKKNIQSDLNIPNINPNQIEDGKIINLRYKVESNLIHAVEQGNKKKAYEILYANQTAFSFSERLPNQPMRRIKNLLITFNTILRVTAGRRYVPAILLHNMSEKFANQIEHTNKLSTLHNILETMIADYIDLIKSQSIDKYSKITQTVIEHLITFYDQKINKSELAALCFTHPSHLSRKFKQETNLTLTEYQQKVRIDKAKYLLKNENITIEEIAWSVGYVDASYFARVFKKETGYTPSEFIHPVEL